MKILTLEEQGKVPPLDDLIDRTELHVGIGVGLNEIIFAAGYHPDDYGRNRFMADGTRCPPKMPN